MLVAQRFIHRLAGAAAWMLAAAACNASLATRRELRGPLNITRTIYTRIHPHGGRAHATALTTAAETRALGRSGGPPSQRRWPDPTSIPTEPILAAMDADRSASEAAHLLKDRQQLRGLRGRGHRHVQDYRGQRPCRQALPRALPWRPPWPWPWPWQPRASPAEEEGHSLLRRYPSPSVYI